MIPVPVKLFKLLINEMGTLLENSQAAQEDQEDSDSEVSSSYKEPLDSLRLRLRLRLRLCLRLCLRLRLRLCLRLCLRLRLHLRLYLHLCLRLRLCLRLCLRLRLCP